MGVFGNWKVGGGGFFPSLFSEEEGRVLCGLSFLFFSVLLFLYGVSVFSFNCLFVLYL